MELNITSLKTGILYIFYNLSLCNEYSFVCMKKLYIYIIYIRHKLIKLLYRLYCIIMFIYIKKTINLPKIQTERFLTHSIDYFHIVCDIPWPLSRYIIEALHI